MVMTQNGNSGRTRAVILTTQRTGSTFLVECLDSHPQVECASEILIGAADRPSPEYRGRFKPVAKIARLIRSGAWRPGHRMERFYADGSAPVRVFKVMYNQLSNPFASRYLQQNEDIRILHLRRHNLLKVHVSKLLMPKRARVQAFKPTSRSRSTWIRPRPSQACKPLARCTVATMSFLRGMHACRSRTKS